MVRSLGQRVGIFITWFSERTWNKTKRSHQSLMILLIFLLMLNVTKTRPFPLPFFTRSLRLPAGSPRLGVSSESCRLSVNFHASQSLPCQRTNILFDHPGHHPAARRGAHTCPERGSDASSSPSFHSISIQLLVSHQG